MLVVDRLGQEIADRIDWSAPRLVCIGGEFTKSDELAIQQINRNIELIRYRKYGEQLLLFELMNAVTAWSPRDPDKTENASATTSVSDVLATAPVEIVDLFEALRAFCSAPGDDVQVKTMKPYFAFRRIKNFACVEINGDALVMHLNVDPDSVALVDGFTRDVRAVGHWGTGSLQMKISQVEDLEAAKPLIAHSYENS